MSFSLGLFESASNGLIRQSFLEVEVDEGVTVAEKVTKELTTEANEIMDSVIDIVTLPHLKDEGVVIACRQARQSKQNTIDRLIELDFSQTDALKTIESTLVDIINQMLNLKDMFVENYFIDGTSNVNALSRNRSLMMAGSDIPVKLFAMGLSVGYLSEHEAALRIEQSISHKVIENDDLNIAGTYYTLADGRIIRAFIGPSGKEMYSFVKGIPKPDIEAINMVYSDHGESTFESRHRVLGGKNPPKLDGLAPYAIVGYSMVEDYITYMDADPNETTRETLERSLSILPVGKFKKVKKAMDAIEHVNTATNLVQNGQKVKNVTDLKQNELQEYIEKLGKGTVNLKPVTLNNVEARKWYLEQEANIPNLINKNAPIEKQARQAFELRNQYRTQARELMADRDAATSLSKSDPNLTWEQIVQRQKDKGLTGDDIYKGIIESSQKSRKSVNESLGLE